MSWLSPSEFPRHCRLRLPAIGRQQARPDGHDITEQTLALHRIEAVEAAVVETPSPGPPHHGSVLSPE